MTIEIANRLIELRKSKGLSQEELAEKLGISRQAVSKWERADSSPDIDNIIMLSRLYGISVDELLCNEHATSMDESELEFEKAPSFEDAPMGGSDGITCIEVAARADLEITASDDSVCSVNIDGPEEEKEKIRVFTDGAVLHIIMDEDEGFFRRMFGFNKTASITVRAPGRMQSIDAQLKGGSLKSAGVSFESFEAKLGGGRAAIEDCTVGGLELETGGGSIILRNVSGRDCELLTGGGSIKAETVDFSSRLEAKTGGGSVVVSGRALEAEAVSGGGDVRLNLTAPERVEARTGGGGVLVELHEVESFSAKLTSGGGRAKIVRGGEVLASGRSVNIGTGDARTSVEARSGGGSVKVVIG